MIIVPFSAEHLAGLRLQPAQCLLSAQTPVEVERMGGGYTALSHGEPIACAGMVEIWPERALAWAYLGAECGAEFVGLHRQVLAHLKAARWRRVEAYVDAGFENGHRWTKALGFAFEGVLRAFMADGRDMALYARVR